MSIEGKTAVVTGGSRGIGRAVCLRLAAMGAQVAVNYVSRPDAADEVVAEIEKNGGKAASWKFNVSDGAEVAAAFKDIAQSGPVETACWP